MTISSINGARITGDEGGARLRLLANRRVAAVDSPPHDDHVDIVGTISATAMQLSPKIVFLSHTRSRKMEMP
jgi:hypothetical protein